MAVLHLIGVALGVGHGLFDPAGDVTWAQAATLAGRLFRFPPRPQYAPVGTPVWASGFLGYAIEHGYVPQGESPADVVSRGTFLLLLGAAAGAGTSPAAWSASGLVCGRSGGFDGSDPLTRASVRYRASNIVLPAVSAPLSGMDLKSSAGNSLPARCAGRNAERTAKCAEKPRGSCPGPC